jgi:hypothetical protein
MIAGPAHGFQNRLTLRRQPVALSVQLRRYIG